MAIFKQILTVLVNVLSVFLFYFIDGSNSASSSILFVMSVSINGTVLQIYHLRQENIKVTYCEWRVRSLTSLSGRLDAEPTGVCWVGGKPLKLRIHNGSAGFQVNNTEGITILFGSTNMFKMDEFIHWGYRVQHAFELAAWYKFGCLKCPS